MIPKHFSLVKEHPQSYEIHDSRDKRKFHIAKAGLNLAMHGDLSKIKKYAEGTPDVEPEPNSTPAPEKEAAFNPDDFVGPTTTPPEPSFAQGIGQDVRGAFGSAANMVGDAVDTVASPVIGGASDFLKGVVGAPPVQNSSGAPQGDSGDDLSKSIQQDPDMGGKQVSNPNNPVSEQALNSTSALENEKKAVQGGVDAEKIQGEKTAAALQDVSDELSTQKTPNDYLDENQAKQDTLEKGYANKTIDYNRLFHDSAHGGMGTGQKIASAIGLIFGGLTGSSGAFDTIQTMINRDIDAQKNDQSKAYNLWKMNREATNDRTEATIATQNQLLGAVKVQIQQYAAEAGGPLAAARAAPALTQVEQQINMNKFRLAALQSGGRNGGVSAMDPAMLMSTIPSDKQPAVQKDIDEATFLNQSKSAAVKAWDQIAELNTPANWAKNPYQTKSKIDALRNNGAVAAARDLAGRVNEYEFNSAKQLYKDAIDNRGSSALKRQNFLDHFNAKKVPGTAFKAATGMDLDNFQKTSLRDTAPPSDQVRNAQIQYARQNISSNDPHAQARVKFIRQKYGI